MRITPEQAAQAVTRWIVQADPDEVAAVFQSTFGVVSEAKITDSGEEIIVDPCFLPVSADAASGRAVIDAIAAIRRRWPDIHIGGGCSNISYGLPKRRYVNFALLCQAIYHGMDTGLIDPCVPDILGILRAAEAVAGRDEFCMNYVTKMR